MERKISYKPIITIKESKKSTILLAMMEEYQDPVIVKRLKGASAEVYESLQKVDSLHIPKVYAWGQQGDELIVVEEYLDGETLKNNLENRKLSEHQKLSVALQMCEAVEVLHNCTPPIIHRDIKPSNILISEEGIVRLIDFDASRQYKIESNTSDTRILGTMEYAAPEQYGYMQTDVRSDIYSIGVVLNGLGFEGNPLSKRFWKRVVDRCTNFDPGNRYRSVKKLTMDIHRVNVVQHHFVKLLCGMVCLFLLLFGGIGLGVQERLTMAESGLDKKEQEETSVMGTVTQMPTPTVEVTVTPTMEATPTQLPTPTVKATPTQMPTPTVKATPTQVPKPTITEAPVQMHVVASEDGTPFIEQVPWLEDGQELLIYTSFFEMVTEITEVIFYRTDGVSVTMPKEAYRIEDSILHIEGNAVQSLAAGEYELLVKYEMAPITISKGISVWLRLYSKGEEVKKSKDSLATDYLDYWYGAHDKLHAVLFANATAVITGLYQDGMPVPKEQYRILCQGRAMELSEEVLRMCKTQPELVFQVSFDDDTMETLVIANPYMGRYGE